MLARWGHALSAVRYPPPGDVTWKLVGVYEPLESRPDGRYEIAGELWRFITALRLHETGDVGYTAQFDGRCQPVPPDPWETMLVRDGEAPRSEAFQYLLSSDMLPTIAKLMSCLLGLRAAPESSGLEPALLRFGRS